MADKKKTKSINDLILVMKNEVAEDTTYIDYNNLPPVEVFPTNSLIVNEAISRGKPGRNGIPRGRVTELYGAEQSGKTTLALGAIVSCQRDYRLPVVFIDTENALDFEWAEILGVDLSADMFIYLSPETAEEGWDLAEFWAKTGAVGLIVIDSVAAMLPNVEAENANGKSNIGVAARLNSAAMRKLPKPLKDSNTALILINQVREKVGVMFGNPRTTPGGHAIKFAASLRIEVDRSTAIKEKGNDSAVGNEVRVHIEKNKISLPHAKVRTSIEYGVGFDQITELITLAVEKEVLIKKGAFYKWVDPETGEVINIGQGAAQTKTYLIENPDMYQLVYDGVFPEGELINENN